MNIVITGASNGIGRALALQCAKNGHHVIAISRSEEKLNQLKEECKENITPLPFDLTQVDSYQTLYIDIKIAAPVIDVLVNNAGRLVNKDFLDIQEKDFDDIYNTNVKAPFFLTQILWPLMESSDLKQIINIGSIGGVMNTEKFPGLSAYSSSKGAISILSECLARELSPKGGVVNCLALGAVQTEMLSDAFPGYKPNLTPEKMAKYILNFIQENRQIVNGKVLQIGGVDI